MSFSTTTLTHTFTGADGTPATGNVTFTLVKAMSNGTQTVLPTAVTSTLVDGAISQSLMANNDTGTDPPDAQWRVDMRLNDLDPLVYFITVPTGGGTVDLGSLLPSEGTSVPYDLTTQWQPFLDVDLDVKPYLQFSSSNTQWDPQLTSITEMACTWVQNYLSKPIPPTVISRRFNGSEGWQGAYIYLPYYPVLGNVAITEWWGGSGPHVLVEQTPEAQGGGEMFTVNRQTGVITRTFAGLIEKPFFPGARNVEVTWTAGYNPVPKDIRMATLQMVSYYYSNTQEANRMATPGSMYDDVSPNEYSMMPAVPPLVYKLLAPYVDLRVG